MLEEKGLTCFPVPFNRTSLRTPKLDNRFHSSHILYLHEVTKLIQTKIQLPISTYPLDLRIQSEHINIGKLIALARVLPFRFVVKKDQKIDNLQLHVSYNL